MTNKDLNNNEYNPYYGTYIDKCGVQDLGNLLTTNHIKILSFLNNIPQEKMDFRYAEGKWTIKEIIQHLIDTERVFAYRAMCIARKDKTLLPGFDQDLYVINSNANNRNLDALLVDYKATREATIRMFDGFDESMMTEIGISSNSDLSVRAAGFIIVGHENHHCEVIKDRYLDL